MLLPFLYRLIEYLDDGELLPVNSHGNQYGVGELLTLSDESERFLKLYEEFQIGKIDDIDRLKRIAGAARDESTGTYKDDDGGCIVM